MTTEIRADDGRILWHVAVTQSRETTIYVLAETKEQAQDDAEELTFGLRDDEWEDTSDDIYVTPAYIEPPRDTLVWTGGLDGKDVDWGSVR